MSTSSPLPPDPAQRPVLVVFDTPEQMPYGYDYRPDLDADGWETELDVVAALEELGWNVRLLGLHNDISQLLQAIHEHSPSVILNLVERFAQNPALDQNVVACLELLNIPFTGCSSLGLTLCKNKSLSKKLLAYHRIRVPQFLVYQKGQPVVRPAHFPFPIFVKPLNEEASYGIAQASLVESDDQLRQRVLFIHERFGQDAIAEEYIPGREIYVSLMGHKEIQVFPFRELVFSKETPDDMRFASYKAKWDIEYRERWGIQTRVAHRMDALVEHAIRRRCKAIYRILGIDGYARIDLRLSPKNEIVFLEANPNPMLADYEDFALAAQKGGLAYPQLLNAIIALAQSRPR